MRSLVWFIFFVIIAPSVHAEEPARMVENGTRQQYCDFPSKRLYERDGAFFCAPYGWAWHGDTHYVVLGDDLGAFKATIGDAVALAQRLTGSRMIEGGTPELVFALAKRPWNSAQIRERAASHGAVLTSEDARWLEKLVTNYMKSDRGGSGWMGYPVDGRHHSVGVVDGRPYGDAADRTERIGDSIREYILKHFFIERAQGGPVESMCDIEHPAPVALPVLPEGTDGHRCGPKALYKHEDGFFCSRYPKQWPREATYALAGPGKNAYSADVAASAEHIRRLTGRRMTESAIPDMMLLLVEKPFSRADLEAAITQAGVKPGSDPHGESMDVIGKLLAMQLRMTDASQINGGKPVEAVPYLTERSCAEVRLRDLILTKDRTHAAVAKDIDDAFLQFFAVTPTLDEVSKAGGDAK